MTACFARTLRLTRAKIELMYERTPVYDEWERLVTEEDRQATEPAWRILYDSCRENDAWIVSFDDACLVSILGMTIFMGSDRFAESSSLADTLCDHPDCWDPEGGFDWPTWAEVYKLQGQSMILDGDSEGGLQRIKKIVDSESWEYPNLPTIRCVIARNAIAELCNWNSERCVKILPQLRAFAASVLRKWPEHSDMAKEVAMADSVEELQRLLNSTYKH